MSKIERSQRHSRCNNAPQLNDRLCVCVSWLQRGGHIQNYHFRSESGLEARARREDREERPAGHSVRDRPTTWFNMFIQTL